MLRRFDLGRTFPLILLPANTLGHLLTRQDQADYLQCVRRHLFPDGHFVLKMFVPDSKQLLRHQPKEQTFGSFTEPASGKQIHITYTYDYEPDTQIKRHLLYTYVDDAREPLAGSLDMRMVYPQELDLLLEHNGFRVVHKWGDRDRSPFGPDSPTQIVVSRPT